MTNENVLMIVITMLIITLSAITIVICLRTIDVIETKSSNKSDSNETLDMFSKALILFAFFLILFSLFAPFIFTKGTGKLSFLDTGPIGDTIGGTMGPFIALAGVFITFLAFYMQFRANQIQRILFNEGLEKQRELFDEQIKNDKEQQAIQLSIEKEQYRRSQFESQFYEMLRLHKENVNEMIIEGYDLKKSETYNPTSEDYTITTESFSKVVTGRKVFVTMNTELVSCYEFFKIFSNEELNKYELINRAYTILFFGLDDFLNNAKEPLDKEIAEKIKEIRNKHIKSYGQKNIFGTVSVYIKYKPYSGHQSRLAHYYRHLFQMVKYVASQDESFISYEEKRNYLRILRAQLSNHEQLMLFYNWLSDFGRQWEDDRNKFFSDYRMVHNLYQDLIIEDFNLEEIILGKNHNYRKEKNRLDDSLFEYMDWI